MNFVDFTGFDVIALFGSWFTSKSCRLVKKKSNFFFLIEFFHETAESEKKMSLFF